MPRGGRSRLVYQSQKAVLPKKKNRYDCLFHGSYLILMVVLCAFVRVFFERRFGGLSRGLMGTFQKYIFFIYRSGETFEAVRPFSHNLAWMESCYYSARFTGIL